MQTVADLKILKINEKKKTAFQVNMEEQSRTKEQFEGLRLRYIIRISRQLFKAIRPLAERKEKGKKIFLHSILLSRRPTRHEGKKI